MRSRAGAATPGPWEMGDWWHIQGESHCRCDAGPLAWSGIRDINGTRMAAHVHRRTEPIGTDIMQADVSNGSPANISCGSDFGPGVDDADAEHIASWHPAVALAVADWLDRVASMWDTTSGFPPFDVLAVDALYVANTYLGADS